MNNPDKERFNATSGLHGALSFTNLEKKHNNYLIFCHHQCPLILTYGVKQTTNTVNTRQFQFC